MICKNCGANIANGLRECEYCGSPIDTSQIGVRTTSTTQSFISLLSFEEKQMLSSYMSNGNLAEAQKFVMKAFGFNGKEAYDIINQVVKYRDAAIPNVDTLLKNLAPKTQNILFYNDALGDISNAKEGALGKYLVKQGYTTDERILLLYDNAIFKTGESGFTITNKRFYSSGSFLVEKAFAIALQDIKTIQAQGSTLLINDKKVDIVLVDANDYLKVCSIVSIIIHSNR